MRSGCFCQSRNRPLRQPPASMSACTRASPSAVSAVSADEKKADPRRAAAKVTYCQVGTKVSFAPRLRQADEFNAARRALQMCQESLAYRFQSYFTISVWGKK